jgi:hypothetical protein
MEQKRYAERVFICLLQVGIGFDFQLLRTISTIARSKISLVALPYRGTS